MARIRGYRGRPSMRRNVWRVARLRRRMRYMRRARPLTSQNRVYSFKRCVNIVPYAIVDGNPVPQPGGGYISNLVATGNYTFGHLRFKLNDLPGNTDFTNLYEKYKITGVKLKFIPLSATEATLGSATAFMAPLALAINRGAITTTADDRTFDQLLENQDVRIFTSQKTFNMYIPYPKFYAPADGITAAQEKGGWLNSKHPAVHHFGLNWAFQTTTATAANQVQFRIIATYYVKCCNPQ